MLLRAPCAAALPLIVLLVVGAQIQPVVAQEDCFNDDDTLARNDLEPPLAPIPALTVTDADLAQVLASIAAHQRRDRERRAQAKAETETIVEIGAQIAPIKP